MARPRTTSAIAAAIVMTVASSSLAQDYSYRYFKDARPLRLEPASVAVLDADRVLDAVDVDDDRGIVEAEGWRRVATPAAARTAAGIEGLVAELADDDRLGFASPVFLDEAGGPTVIRPEILVRFVPGVGQGAAQAILDELGAGVITVADWHGQPGLHRVAAASRNGFEVLDAANALAARDDVVFAEPNRIMTIFPADVIPNDPGFPSCWGLHNTGQAVNGWTPVANVDQDCPEAWDHVTGSGSIIVAILDSGIQQNHPDINQVTPGIDTTFFNGDGGPIFDFDNHGTAVAGCVTAIMNNSTGTVGVAPGARSISVKIAYDASAADGWTTQADWVADGVFAASAAGARVTNSSFLMGSSGSVTFAYDVTSTSVIHFAAAGNGGDDSTGDPFLVYPASISSTVAVAAITPTGVLTGFSNYGLGLGFAAPGTSLWTTDRTGSDGYGSGSYTWFSGTSGACPYAAGVAALVLSANPGLSATSVKSIMNATAKDLGTAGYDIVYGWGIPDAHGAVVEALFGADCPGAGNCTESNGTPGCDDADCCYAVCDADPFCCNSSWDGLCADQAVTLCYGCGQASAGDCFESNGSPGCDDATCCADVCAVDPFCCEVSWDSICAAEASDLCAPDNDTCTTAIDVTDGTWVFSNVGAATDGPAEPSCDFCCGDDQIGSDVWYRYQAPCSGELTVSTCNSASFDTKIAVYGPGFLGGTCPTGTIFGGILLGCNDDAAGCGGFTSTLTVPVTGGDFYRIRIGGYDGAQGSGTFSVSCAIPNDTCGGAIEVTDGTWSFSNIGAATDGPAEPSCDFCCGDDQVGADVWYRYDATCTGELTVSTCDTADFDTKIAVYAPGAVLNGSCPNGTIFGGVLIGCNDDLAGCGGFTSSVTVAVQAGTSYRIRLGGYNEAQGSGTFLVSCQPGDCPGDLDANGVVDGADLGLLLANWGGAGETDLDGDGTTGGGDLGLLLGAWGPCGG